MKKSRLFVLLLVSVLVIGHMAAAECSALEYCWNLAAPGKTVPASLQNVMAASIQSIKVGVLDIGNGHFMLAGLTTLNNIFSRNEWTGYVTNGNAELRNNVLEVSLHMSSRDNIAVIPGDASTAIMTMVIHMRLDPVTLSGDYSMMFDGAKGTIQFKGAGVNGKVTSVSCN
ncbi:MAG: hypothetical protein HQK60_00060 [Deltaproteobacteria bacterium]|nr:hypothetical protein [Deltaproteobacteria bacterium]